MQMDRIRECLMTENSKESSDLHRVYKQPDINKLNLLNRSGTESIGASNNKAPWSSNYFTLRNMKITQLVCDTRQICLCT